VQSFQEDKLKSLGRIHGSKESLSAAASAKQAGFKTFNIDLMFGLPHQSTSRTGNIAILSHRLIIRRIEWPTNGLKLQSQVQQET